VSEFKKWSSANNSVLKINSLKFPISTVDLSTPLPNVISQVTPMDKYTQQLK
jgi:hypothetical protein